jgi:medium-chain acyl-[acyl-carrier-protein] hydrolase
MFDSRVVQVFKQNPQAAATVYGIAHSGGGAAPWRRVSAATDEVIEVRGIRLAGRESRIDTPPYPSVAEAAVDVAQAICEDARRSGRPIFLAGSCSGAVIARVAAEHLTDVFRPLGLLAIRQHAPSTPPPAGRPDLCAMDSSALLAWVREQRLMAPELLQDDQVFQYFEPALRADLDITESYLHAGPPLACPVFLSNVPGGVTARSQWARETTAEVKLVRSPRSGDFLIDHPARLARELSMLVAASLGSRSSRLPSSGDG